MTKRVDIYRVPAERWKQGPSEEWLQRKELRADAVLLMAELMMSRLHEKRVLDLIDQLPPFLPAIGGAASLGLAGILAVHTGPLTALHARACVMQCLEIARGRPRWTA